MKKGGGGGSASAKRAGNTRMAGYMKENKIERTSGMCPICYKNSGNDTITGAAVFQHISRHARGNI